MKVGFIHTHICVHFCVNKTKGFALSLALKQRRKAAQKATLIVIVDNIVIMIMAGSLRYPTYHLVKKREQAGSTSCMPPFNANTKQ